MTKLISKVQYKNFESGEFVDVQERTYEETIELIEKFPWGAQRDKITIQLTNPSITIEGENNDFLKLALFFNQKFVLYYFDESQNLYRKSFINLKDGYEYIRNFFIQPKFDISNFEKETTWFQNNLKHFVIQDFKYVLTSKSIISFLMPIQAIIFYSFILFLIMCVPDGLISFLVIVLSFVGGQSLFFFFNYYNYVKDKVLIISKGQDSFYFGGIDNPKKYDKKDILQYRIIGRKGRGEKWFTIIEIKFKNETVLKIPNLLINYTTLEQKLFEYPRIDVDEFPFLKL